MEEFLNILRYVNNNCLGLTRIGTLNSLFMENAKIEVLRFQSPHPARSTFSSFS